MFKRSISPEIKSKLDDINAGEVEALLRRVRLSFYKPSPHLVELLHDKISTLSVANFTNMDAYILEFKQIATQLNNCGGKVDDSLIKMWLLKGLPSDYNMVKFHVQASPAGLSLADTYLAIASFAATDPRLTGSTHPAYKAGRRDRASTASEPKSEELCKAFAKTGKCNYGDKCKWKHVMKPVALGATQPPTRVSTAPLKPQQAKPPQVPAVTTARSKALPIGKSTPLRTAAAKPTSVPLATRRGNIVLTTVQPPKIRPQLLTSLTASTTPLI